LQHSTLFAPQQQHDLQHFDAANAAKDNDIMISNATANIFVMLISRRLPLYYTFMVEYHHEAVD